MACLDTNVLIDLGSPRRPNHTMAIQTVERSTDRLAETKRVQRVLSTLVILEFDAVAAEHFGRAQARQLKLGRPVGSMDILIASVCLANGQRLITRNAKHFADVQGLLVESY